MKPWIISVVFLLFSCNKNGGVMQNAGPLTTQIFNLNSFTDIEVNRDIELVLVQDGIEKIEIVYGKNLINKVTAKVVNGVLKLTDNNRLNWLRKPMHAICSVHVKVLNKVTCNASSFVKCANPIVNRSIFFNNNSSQNHFWDLNVGYFQGVSEASGGIFIKGRVNIIAYTCKLGSILDAVNTDNDDVYLFNNTKNECKIAPKNILIATINNTGGVKCYTKPKNKVERLGTGLGKIVFE